MGSLHEIEVLDAVWAIRHRPHMYMESPLYCGDLLRIVVDAATCGPATAVTVTSKSESIEVRWAGDGRLADLTGGQPWLSLATEVVPAFGAVDGNDGQRDFFIATWRLVIVRALSRRFRASATNEQRRVTVEGDHHNWSSQVFEPGGSPSASVTFSPDPERVGPSALWSRWVANECARLPAVAPSLPIVQRRR